MLKSCFIIGVLWVFTMGFGGISFVFGGDETNFMTVATAVSTNTAVGERLLKPNDSLVVSIYQQPDLTTRVVVDGRGVVMLPLIGSVKLGGMTLQKATDLIQKMYDRDYLVEPKVTIQMDQFAILRFTILGQVQRPGSYDFPQNESLSLLDGVAKAGGFTRLAARARVTLQRNVDGELKLFTLDADAMSKDPKNPPFQLLPGDTINVEERIF